MLPEATSANPVNKAAVGHGGSLGGCLCGGLVGLGFILSRLMTKLPIAANLLVVSTVEAVGQVLLLLLIT
jgi:hypothetical protein